MGAHELDTCADADADADADIDADVRRSAAVHLSSPFREVPTSMVSAQPSSGALLRCRVLRVHGNQNMVIEQMSHSYSRLVFL